MEDYRLFADRLAADVAAGRLRPGDRLPPQRRFARENGIASSTASRVYGELVRRGLAVGEVGRGTFVRAADAAASGALAEPAAARVDLELNFPLLPGQTEELTGSLDALLRSGAMPGALRPATVSGTAASRAAAARLLRRDGWQPAPERVLFAGNGRQALAGVLAALVPAGERLAVEALTYPVVKGIAARLGIRLVPVAVDDRGMRPDALRATGSLAAVYLQTTLHNPLGITMDDDRRHALADVLAERDLIALEDQVNGYLDESQPPLAGVAPERTVLVDSLSKRLSAGLSVGFAVAPVPWTDRVAAAVRSGGWTPSGFALAAAAQWVEDGTAERVQRAKRADAAERQRLVAERLAGFTVHANPAAYHCWWELPPSWQPDTFVVAAARRGIAVSPAAAFAVAPAAAPNAVRLALGSPSRQALADALDVLARLARSHPDDVGIE
ncbi:MAG TPA: PLP-dependent aminotransferase family protein [Kribbellaceae bacterium]|nr:PLP-dependent aminotransferase family protein [Kribbellaceae bacterium]